MKRKIMISDYSEGGLKMIDFIPFNKALKSTWVKKYLDQGNHGKWEHLFEWQLQRYGGPAIFRGNLNKQDMYKYVTTTDTFTKEILYLWSEISYERNVNSLDHFLSLPLWHNSLIPMDNKPIFYQSWYSKSVRNVADLLKDRNVLLSLHELKHRFNVKANFLTLLGPSVLSTIVKRKMQRQSARRRLWKLP